MKLDTASTVIFIGLASLAACSGESPRSLTQSTSVQNPSAELVRLADRVAALEHRRSLVQDLKDIKRLQRAYGYYLDQALWDEVADLFVADGTIEIGLDGVYVGKARIREYLYALGGGSSGLSQGELNEHMQLMPVITVAPDGLTAKGRWRAIVMAGRLGENAIWGEGPYENEYVKEDGVWKLKTAHWFQSVVVPYEGGWQVNEDVNGGKWVGDALPPDRPSTVEYATWPSVWLPPFHFPNPVRGQRPAPPRASEPAPAPVSTAALAARAAVLAQELALLEDQNAVERLQRAYGFYIDEALWSAAADLFAADATAEIGASGVYVGKAHIKALLQAKGAEFPQPGRLYDRMQLQPIVHVSPDGLTAKGRWRLFAQEAVSGEYAHWGVGVYENDYVKEAGVWKIASLHAYHRMYTPYEDGWGKTALPNVAPEGVTPDRPPSVAYEAYPATFAAPFHYENPVTGGPTYARTAADFAPPAAADIEALEALLAALDERIVRLADLEELERLNAIYGYYLAHNQWDNLTAIFAPDGAIEIAMRGVYVGAASVRRNLNLYGEAGIHYGLLHNHMQYQPVISLAEDGQSALMRSRAFSIMGQYEAYSMWMGGMYENLYVKRDGIWMIERDQVFNTYFTPYTTGWKDLAPRPPPGITAGNPPDQAPTVSFDMYPGAFLVPFHYPHPVTGEPVTAPASR
jgi:hypothetical protein